MSSPLGPWLHLKTVDCLDSKCLKNILFKQALFKAEGVVTQL